MFLKTQQLYGANFDVIHDIEKVCRLRIQLETYPLIKYTAKHVRICKINQSYCIINLFLTSLHNNMVSCVTVGCTNNGTVSPYLRFYGGFSKWSSFLCHWWRKRHRNNISHYENARFGEEASNGGQVRVLVESLKIFYQTLFCIFSILI